MAFIDLQTEVKSNIIDLPPAVAANVNTYINRAVRKAEQKYTFKYMEKSIQVATSAGSLDLTPDTVQRFKGYLNRGPYVIQQYSPAIPLYIANDDGEAQKTFALNSSFPDRPHFLRLISLDQNNTAVFNIYPYPDANSDWNDGNYQIIIPYEQYSAPFVNNTDSNWLSVNGDTYLVELATAYGFQANWDYNSTQFWLSRAEQHWNEIKLADKKLRISGIDTLVSNYEGANQGMVQR